MAVGQWLCKVIMGDVEVRVSPCDMAVLVLVLLHSC